MKKGDKIIRTGQDRNEVKHGKSYVIEKKTFNPNNTKNPYLELKGIKGSYVQTNFKKAK